MNFQLLPLGSSMEVFLSLFFCLAFTTFNFKTSTAIDFLTVNQILRDNSSEALVSTNGTFAFGFFSPWNSTNRYLGIWLNNVPDQTVVWVANRDSPLTDLSGAVTLVANGSIVISQNSMKNIVLSSNPSTTSNNPILQLLSTGNIVVKDIGSDDISNNYIWQSFDYPCDTLIPGMKLGWDLTTGQNWFLTSWKSLQDPSAGLYTYKLDIKGLPQVHLHRGSDIIYRSGPWDGVMWDGLRLGGGLQMKGFQIFKSIFIYNSNYIYFSFDNSDNNMISRFLVDSSGMLNYFTWNQKSNEWFLMFSLQKDLCDAYSRCGPNGICNENQVPICHCPTGFVPKVTEEWYSMDWSSGCVPRKPLNCSTNEGFMRFPNLKLPDNSYAMQSSTTNQESCADACPRNCLCVAYATTELIDCVIWFGDLLDVRERG